MYTPGNNIHMNYITKTATKKQQKNRNSSHHTASHSIFPHTNNNGKNKKTTKSQTTKDPHRDGAGHAPRGDDRLRKQIQKNATIPAGNQDRWGHTMSQKTPNTIRLLLQNVGGINLKPEGSIKLAAVHSFMQEAQVDVAALTECNVAWNLAERDLYPPEQTKCWWENAHWSIMHNKQEKYATTHQQGRTCVVVTNQLSYRAQHPGNDMMGLGQWCWARLRGKQDWYLWVVLIYRPCPSNRPLSTYNNKLGSGAAKMLTAVCDQKYSKT